MGIVASGLLVAGCGTGTTAKADTEGGRGAAPSPAAQSRKLSFAEFDKKHCSIATAAELATAVKAEYAKWDLRPTMKPTADTNSCSYPVKGNVRYGGGAITIRHGRGAGALVFLHVCEQEINDGKPESYAKRVDFGDEACEDGFAAIYTRIGSDLIMVSADLVAEGALGPDERYLPVTRAAMRYFLSRFSTT